MERIGRGLGSGGSALGSGIAGKLRGNFEGILRELQAAGVGLGLSDFALGVPRGGSGG